MRRTITKSLNKRATQIAIVLLKTFVGQQKQKTKTKQNKTAKTKNNTFVLQIKPERKSKLRKSLICYRKIGFN
jgi:hypothetical protein